MKRSKQSTSEATWRERIEASKSFDGSAVAYCQAHGIDVTSFYKWRRRLKNERETQKASRFVSAVVQAEPQVVPSRHSNLPEAKWVAEVLAHFIRSFES